MVAAVTPAAGGYPASALASPAFAGFWRRFAAWIIDWALISAVVFGLFTVAAFTVPRVANIIDAASSGLPATERILWEGKVIESKAKVREAIVETTVLGRLTYVHKVTIAEETREGVTATITSLTNTRVRLDPATRAPYTTNWTIGSLYLLPWLLYMVLMEASSVQATIGKFALGIRVTDLDGHRVGVLRALVRTLMKFVSFALLFIGYLMVAWTQKKQALHDMAAGCVLPVAR